MDDISKRSLYYPDIQINVKNNEYHVGRWTQTHFWSFLCKRPF